MNVAADHMATPMGSIRAPPNRVETLAGPAQVTIVRVYPATATEPAKFRVRYRKRRPPNTVQCDYKVEEKFLRRKEIHLTDDQIWQIATTVGLRCYRGDPRIEITRRLERYKKRVYGTCDEDSESDDDE